MKKESRKRKELSIKNILLYFLFILGLLIMLYPFFSQQYYRIVARQEIKRFESASGLLEDEEVERRIRLAHAYNRTLDPGKLLDPYTNEEKEGVAEYARMLEVQEKIGYVDIPKIDEKIPIYAGTAESILQKGAGHLEGTSLPVGGESTHTVITAHRGLASAKLFRELDKLKEGDIFYIHNVKEKLAYEVDKIIVVEPYDFSPVLVTKGKDYATLLTCTPYMINTHRLLVRGHRVEYEEEIKLEEPENTNTKNINIQYKKYFYIALIFILILLLIIIFFMRQINKRIEEFTQKEED